MSEIRALTKRIGQAKRNGVTELAERLRIARAQLAIHLARNHDTWLLVNAAGETEFVDLPTWKSRVEAWKERKWQGSQAPTVVAETPPDGQAPALPATSSDPVREFFGEPIHCYTRAQALADGVLVDVTPSTAGIFRVPVALTRSLWDVTQDIEDSPVWDQAIAIRIREILQAAAELSRSRRGTDRLAFPLLLQTKTQGLKQYELLAISGPGDAGEHVVTIGFPIDF
jgi:hypothetical protein